jgi:hypothetical protein
MLCAIDGFSNLMNSACHAGRRFVVDHHDRLDAALTIRKQMSLDLGRLCAPTPITGQLHRTELRRAIY